MRSVKEAFPRGGNRLATPDGRLTIEEDGFLRKKGLEGIKIAIRHACRERLLGLAHLVFKLRHIGCASRHPKDQGTESNDVSYYV